ncbi:hypothetical protein [Saccharothrix obliqua]|uniref:hypothetical protein n=1 Tax=Saccharothrix obliqua TaxID=2861747 RepID=UPI001C5FDA50|nr:hypothetical protein [Saccharothrix obliqua]MBW4718016.1 hypothetical protein [Saccharothrix obliqua]
MALRHREAAGALSAAWQLYWTPTEPIAWGRPSSAPLLLDAVFWREVDATGSRYGVADLALFEPLPRGTPPGVEIQPVRSADNYVNPALWIAAAAGSGLVGNAAYDMAKHLVRKFVSHRAKHSDPGTTEATAPPPVDEGREPRRVLDIDLPPAAPPVLGVDDD